VTKLSEGFAHLGLIPVLEYYSKHLRIDSGSSYPVFGDMAAATVLAPAKKGYGILWGLYQTDGKPFHIKGRDSRGKEIGDVTLSKIIKTPEHGSFTMHGQAVGEVAKMTGAFAVKRMDTIIKREGIGEGVQDVDWFVFHQANKGLVEQLADELAEHFGIDKKAFRKKLLFTVEEFANTSAASIPLTLYEKRDQLKEGDLVFMGTFGGGFQWGALLVRWGGTLSLQTHSINELTQVITSQQVEKAL